MTENENTERRGRGRPAVGPAILVRLPPELLDRLDTWSAAEGMSRAAAVRYLIQSGLNDIENTPEN